MRKEAFALPLAALPLLLLGSSCNLQGTGTGDGVNRDASGITTLSVRVTQRGSVEWTFQGEPGLLVYRVGETFAKMPNDGRLFIAGGRPFFLLEPEGTFEVFLRRNRDGKWVKGSIPYRHTVGEDGQATFQTLSPPRYQAVPTEEDLPFYLGKARTTQGKEWNEVPWPKGSISPLALSQPLCLSAPGGVWPYGERPNNTSPDFPPVAPENPPAVYYAWLRAVPGFAMIEYMQGKYVRTQAAQNSYGFLYSATTALAPTREEGSMEVKNVIFAVYYDAYHPLRGRWVRIYPKEPYRLWWEGDRLRCQLSDWQVELMPEDFTIPGYNYDTGVFEMHKGVPMTLPPEWDPYAGR